ncbi:hypothetical protein ZIOFF_063853 [Zingiber officinale]|uniref:CCAAT-binding factor domain-containing protein n=1 Tax=Zingiber officinale TaxID=94328 RepID=A0A8J5F711_ZINOF|nr:hypothetical protein ZIOFF_063853 [Zingiber officinale]
MAASKAQKSDELDALKSDVASFAASLGLAPPTATSSYGFDDSDFRKSGPIKPSKSQDSKSPSSAADLGAEVTAKKKSGSKLVPKPHPLQLDSFNKSYQGERGPHLTLMKASALSGRWYDDADELEAKVLGPDGSKKVTALGIEEFKKLVEKKKELAVKLMAQYTKDYDSSRRKTGDMKLLEVTARSGTSADKVSAFTCLVEDNPIANLRAFDSLLSMVTSKVGKRYAFTGFEALKELFLLSRSHSFASCLQMLMSNIFRLKGRLDREGMLPDRKLKSLYQRPLDCLPETKDGFSLLLFWYWEECLKQRYERFVTVLEEAIKDMLPNLKDKAMKTVFILLKSKPEQERKLLTALVNKLGDPDRKAASGALYHLSCLLSAHPNMTAVVIDEVDSLIFRPSIGLRAKYQAVNFLSQIFLSKKGDGPKVARRLIDIYFALFKVLISEAKDGKSSKNEKKSGLDAKGKRKSGKSGSLKTLKKNNDDEASESNIEMDSRLLSVLLTGVNRAFPFVASDDAESIIEDQTPVLFRLVHSKNFNVGVQALMLLYQISSKNQIVSDRFYRALYAKLLTPAAVSSSKPEMFLGLLFKAMKNDLNMKRVAAFSKRLLQVALQRPPHYACGCLFMMSELLKAKPPLWGTVLQTETVDDDIEHFNDIIEDPEDIIMEQSSKLIKSGASAVSQNNKKRQEYEDDDSEAETSLKDVSKINAVGKQQSVDNQPLNPGPGLILPAGYNPRHREPIYCNAGCASWWELTILASHVHPSVATMSRTLLSGATIVYNGDPLNDLSLTSFIDKFMEKKPKPNRKTEGSWYGGSKIAPARKIDVNSHLIGDEILQLAEDEVAPEDVVFHRFYMNKSKSSKKKPKAKKASNNAEDDDEELLGNDSDAELDPSDNRSSRENGSDDEDDNHFSDDSLDILSDGSEDGGDKLQDYGSMVIFKMIQELLCQYSNICVALNPFVHGHCYSDVIVTITAKERSLIKNIFFYNRMSVLIYFDIEKKHKVKSVISRVQFLRLYKERTDQNRSKSEQASSAPSLCSTMPILRAEETGLN